MIEMNMLTNSSNMELNEYSLVNDLVLGDGESKIKVSLSDNNLEYLRQTLCPQGLIPDDFSMKIVMLNQLIEELEDIRDKDNPDWELKSVYYVGGDVDSTFFDTKEVEI